MNHHTQLDDNLGKDDNFRAWNYKTSLILEENDYDQYTSKKVIEPEGDEVKSIHKRNLVKAKIIIAYFIKDHLIPHVSSLKKPKKVFDSLTKHSKNKSLL